MNAKGKNFWLSFLLATACLMLLLGIRHIGAQGFAGLGKEGEGYEQVVPGTVITFPQDLGQHPDFRIEWWYVTANLQDTSGNHYGIQWTLFRQAMTPGPERLGWTNQQIWMAHAAVTSKDQHYTREIFARGGTGQANVTASPLHAWIDNWNLKAVGADNENQDNYLTLNASGSDFSYDLSLSSVARRVLHGDNGFSRKSDRGQASHYFSAPFLAVNGTITLAGKPVEVTGSGWLDREWSSQPLSPDQTGWDWFSLHLEGGEKVMLFRLRHTDKTAFYSGTWVGADGEAELLVNGDIIFDPVEKSEISGRSVPTAWKVKINSKNLSIQTTALNAKSWMESRFPYWEGPIRFTGSHQGRGYLEMTGY